MENNESMKILQECMELQKKKGDDYQSPDSHVTQADYYPRGLDTLLDIMWGKILRLRSLIEIQRKNPGNAPNFESIEDSGKDLINYASFFVAWNRGKIPGQKKEENLGDPNKKPIDSKISRFDRIEWESCPRTLPPYIKTF